MNTFHSVDDLRAALIHLMRTQGINQPEICRQTDVPQSAISLFVNGKRGLSGESVLAIENFIRTYSIPVIAESGEMEA